MPTSSSTSSQNNELVGSWQASNLSGKSEKNKKWEKLSPSPRRRRRLTIIYWPWTPNFKQKVFKRYVKTVAIRR